MVEVRLESATLFRKILDAIRDLVEEANIECNEEGLSLQAMDASHVALVALNLLGSGFDSYKCPNEVTLGVNVGSIQKILKCGDTTDNLTLRSNEENSELKFTFENSTSDRFFEFSLSLMDIEVEHLAIPESEPDAVITLSSAEFSRICRDLTQFGDTVKISVTGKTITFAVAGNTGNGSIVLSNFAATKGDSQVSIQCESPLELSFALKYLNYFTKASSLADTVELQLSNDRPLLVQYKLPDDAGSIKYYLAPKVADEDEAEE